MKTNEEYLLCPNCGSKKVCVTVEQKFMVNTGEHYCHSVKAHDSNANCTCLECRWEGMRATLVSNLEGTTMTSINNI
jgi:hypothetical protein